MRAALWQVGIVATILVAVAGPASSAPISDHPAPYNYVALGDSYTAATGFTGPPDATHVPVGCFQSHTDYPHQVAATLRRERRLGTFVDASCGGATTAHFTKPQYTRGGTNPPQFRHIDRRTTLVTIGIGGNDVGMETLAEECLRRGLTGTSCKAAHVIGGVDRISALIDATEPSIEATIDAVRVRAAENVRVLVVNYLEVVPDNGHGCYPAVPVAPADARWFTAKFKHLNAMLATAARRRNAQLVDTYRRSIGHNACTGPTTRYVELVGVVSLNPTLSLAAPIHPNIAGADAQTRAVVAAIG